MKTKISEASVANKTGSSVKDYLKQEVGVGDVYFASLEPRIALDAAAGADIVDEVLDTTDVELEAVELTAPVAQSASAADLVQMLEADAEAGSASDLSRQIVFVDASIDNFDEFIAGLPDDIETYVISPDHDGISQIASTLAGRSGIEAIHIVSHGDAGALILGDSLVTAESIQGRYADDLAAIGASLTDSADLLIYGCDFAFGAEGVAAADLLASATGADVAASTDITGSEIFGGDWVLEHETGEIEADALQVDEWEGKLNNTVVEVSLDGSYNFSADDFDGGRDGTISTITIVALPTDGELTLNGEAVVEGQEIAAADLGSLLYTPPAGGDVNVDYRLYYSVDDDVGPNPSPPVAIVIDTYADYTVPNADYFATTASSPAAHPVRAFNILAVPDGGPAIFTHTGSQRQVGGTFTQAQVDAGQVVVRYNSGEFGEPIDGLVVEVQRDINTNNFTSDSGSKFWDNKGFNNTIGDRGRLMVSDGSRLLSDGIYARTDAGWFTRTLVVPSDAAYFETLITGLVGQSANVQVNIFGDAADGTRTLLHSQVIANDPMVDIKLDVSGYESLDLEYQTTDGIKNRHWGMEKPVFTMATSQIVTSAQEVAAIDTRGLQAPPAGATWDSFELSSVPDNGVLQLGGVDLVAGTSYQMSDLDNVLFVPNADTAVGRDAELFSLSLTASDGSRAQEVVSIDILSSQNIPTSTDVSIAVEHGTSQSFSAADFAFAGLGGNSVDEVIIDFLPSWGTLTLSGVAVTTGQAIAVSDIENFEFAADVGTFGTSYKSFDFRVRDSAGTLSDTYSVTVEVYSRPEITVPSITVPAGEVHSFAVRDFGFSDADGDAMGSIIIDAVPSLGGLRLNGVLVAAGQEITVEDLGNLTFDASAVGTTGSYDSFSIRLGDEDGHYSDVTVVGIDIGVPPTTADNTISTAEDIDYAFSTSDFAFSDDNVGDSFVAIVIDSLPASGAFTLNGVAVTVDQEIAVADIANLVYSPPANTFGTDFASFTFSVKDSTNLYSLSSSTMTIDVTSVEDAPETANNTVTTAEDTDFAFAQSDFGFSDVDADSTFAAVIMDSLPESGLLVLNGVDVTIGQEIAVANIASLVFSPAANANGPASFTFSVKDSAGLVSEASSTMIIDVSSVEDAPEGTDNTISVAEDTDHIFSLVDFGFSDVDNLRLNNMVIGVPVEGSYSFSADDFYALRGGTASSITIAALPTAGGLTLNGVAVVEGQEIAAADFGSLLYTPPAGGNVNADHSFYYTIVDDIGPNPSPVMRTLLDSYAEYTPDADYFVDTSQLATTMTLRSFTVLAVPDGSPVIYTSAGVPIPLGGTFTQAQADAGEIVIHYNSGETGEPIDGLIIGTNHNLDVAQLTLVGDGEIYDNGHVGITPLRSYDASHIIDDGLYIYVKPTLSTYQVDVPADATHFEAVSTQVDPVYNRIPDLNVQYYGVNADGTSTLLYEQIMSDEPVADLSLDVSGYDTLEITTISTDGIASPANTNLYLFVLEKPVFTLAPEEIVTGEQETHSTFAAVIIDSLPSSGAITLDGVDVTAGQEIAVADIANLVYSPAANANGPASFTFSVKDDFGLVSDAPNTMTFDVTSVEDAPEAADITISTAEDTDFVFTESDFGFSDVDADSTFAAVIIDSLPASGVLSLNGVAVAAGQEIANADIPNLVYSPPADAIGTGLGSFTFSVKDDTGLVSVASNSMTVDVTSVEDAPDAADNTLVGTEDTGFSFAAADFGYSDVDLDSTFAAVVIDSLPASGTLSLGGASVTAGQEIAVADIANLVYSPAANAYGSAAVSFTFSTKDNTGLTSDAYSMSFDIAGTPDAPQGADATVSTAEDTDLSFSQVDFGFSDADADSTFAAVVIDSLPTSGTLALNGVAVTASQEIAVADIANLVYSPPADEFGTGLGSFSFSVKDSTGLTSEASNTITIDVTSVEDAPESADNTVSTAEDTVHDHIFSASDFGFSDVDLDSTFAAVIIDSLPTSGAFTLNDVLVTAGQEIVVADIAGLSYSPPADVFGTAFASFTFSVKDSTGLVSDTSSTMTVDVTSVEDAPDAADNRISTAEDTDHTFGIADFGFSDVDLDSTFAAVVIDALPTSGVLSLNGVAVTGGQEIAVADIANLVYSPPANEFGTAFATFSFSVKDSTGLTSEASNTITIDVTSVEDAPESADNTVSTAEDTDLSFSQGDFGFSDVDLDSTFAAVVIDALPASGTLALNGVAVAASQEIAIADIANLVYSPPADEFGTGLGSFTFSVKDSTGLASDTSSTITIDVTSVEDAPDAADNTVSTLENTDFSFSQVDFGFSDVDLDSTFAAVIIDSPSTFGALTLNGVAVTAGQEIAVADIANLVYSPPVNSFGTSFAFVSFSVKDSTGLVSEASRTIAIDVNSVEHAPEGADSTVTTVEDTDFSFSQGDFGFSDVDEDSTFAAVIVDSLPTSGTLALNGVAVTASQEIAVADIASLVYSPSADAIGTGLASFTFSVKDDTGRASEASSTITIDVTSVEDAPDAADNTVSTAEDTDRTFSVADFGFSDVDLDSTFAAVIIDSLPISGAFTLNGVAVSASQEIAAADIPNLIYSPPTNEFGADFASFTFSVKDNTGLVSATSSSITIDVTSVEDAPESADSTVSTAEDTDVSFSQGDFGFSDVDLDSTFAAVIVDDLPTSGTLFLNGAAVAAGQEIAVADIANLVYSPAADAFGTGLGSFTFSVKDSAGLVSEASNTITIDVTSVEDAPEGADNTVSTAEDTDLSFSQVDFGFSDVDLDSTFAAVIIDALPTSGTLVLNGVAVAASQEIAVADIANLVYSPPADAFGTGLGSFTFTVKDSTGLASDTSSTIAIDVTSVEDAPDAADNTVLTQEDTDFSFSQSDFGFSDVDLDSTLAAVIIDSLPTSGTFTSNGVAVSAGQEIAVADIANLIYSPPANEFGTGVASFSFSVKDSTGLVSDASSSITIDVASVEDAPEGADNTISTAEDIDHTFSVADFGFSDADLDSTFAAVIIDSLPASGTLSVSGVDVTTGQEIAATDIASLVYSPPADAFGTGLGSFTFSVKDSTGLASEASSTITIDVTSVEDAPEGADRTVSTQEDTDRTFSVGDFGFSDADADSTFAAVIIDNLPTSGTLILNGAAVTGGQEIAASDIANLVYSPAADAVGTGLGSFTFSVKDNSGLASDASSTMTIDVTSIEDAPDAADNTISTAEDIDHTFSVADFGFSDVDQGSSFAAVIIDSLPTSGAFTLNGVAVTASQEIAVADIANLVYSPPADAFGTAFASFTFSVKDSTGLTSEASRTITIDVTSVEDAPESADNTVSTAEDTDYTFNIAEFDFSDLDTDSTFAAVVIDSLPASGTLSLNGAAVSTSQEITVADIANLVYSPPADAFGTGLGSFTFSVKDSAGLVSDASSTMTIDVTSVEDAPDAADNTVSTLEDTDFSFSQGNFGFSDVDQGSTFAAVIIDSLPASGTLALNGVAVTADQEIAVADIANLVYSPPADAFGTGVASFTFSVKDSTGLVSEVSSSITIDVTSLEHAPVAADNTISIAEDIDHTFSVADFGFSDVDADSTFAAVIIDSLPASGALSLNGAVVTTGQEIAATDIPNLVFSPPADAFGADFASFAFSVKDSTGLVSEASSTMAIDVTSVEDAPSSADTTVSTAEDTDRAFSVADFGFSDADAGSTFAAVIIDSQPASGTLALNGVAITTGQEIAVADIPNLVYSPPANAFGTDFADFAFSVKDSTGLVSETSNTITIDVTSVADAPEGVDNAVATPQDTGYRFTLADFQYSDIDGNEFASVIIDSLPTSGTLSLNGIAVTTSQEIAHADIEALSFVSEDSSGSMPLSFSYRLRDDGGTSDGGADTSDPYVMNIAVEPVYELSATFAANGVLEIDLTADLAAELNLDAGDRVTRNADPTAEHIELRYLDDSGQRVLFEAGDSITVNQARSLEISNSGAGMTGEFNIGFAIDRADGSRVHVDLLLDVTPAVSGSSEQGGDSQSDTKQLSRVIEHADKIASKVSSISETQSLSLPAVARGFAASGQGRGQSQGVGQSQDFGGASLSTDAESFATGSVAGLQVINRAESSVHNMRVDLAVTDEKLLVAIDDLSAQFGEGGLADGLVVEMLDGSAIPDWITITDTGEIEIDTSESGDVGLVELRVIRNGDGNGDDSNRQGTAVSVNLAENSVQIASGADAEQ